MRCAHLHGEVMGRLGRIEGQVKGLSVMLEDDRYCIDILNQIKAAEVALHSVGELLLDYHLKTCLADAFQAGDHEHRNAIIEELNRIFHRMHAR